MRGQSALPWVGRRCWSEVPSLSCRWMAIRRDARRWRRSSVAGGPHSWARRAWRCRSRSRGSRREFVEEAVEESVGAHAVFDGHAVVVPFGDGAEVTQDGEAVFEFIGFAGDLPEGQMDDEDLAAERLGELGAVGVDGEEEFFGVRDVAVGAAIRVEVGEAQAVVGEELSRLLDVAGGVEDGMAPPVLAPVDGGEAGGGEGGEFGGDDLAGVADVGGHGEDGACGHGAFRGGGYRALGRRRVKKGRGGAAGGGFRFCGKGLGVEKKPSPSPSPRVLGEGKDGGPRPTLRSLTPTLSPAGEGGRTLTLTLSQSTGRGERRSEGKG